MRFPTWLALLEPLPTPRFLILRPFYQQAGSWLNCAARQEVLIMNFCVLLNAFVILYLMCAHIKRAGAIDLP